MAEIWKPVDGYFVAYEVSNLGRVRSVDRTLVQSNGRTYTLKGQYRKPQTRARDGYVTVNLVLNGKRNSTKLHRIVAAAFCDKPVGCSEVNHIDGNKTNNCADNLKWATRKQNVQHQFEVLGQRGPWLGKTGANNASSKPVIIGEQWYPGAAEAARQLGISQSTITHAITRKHKLKGIGVSYG